MYRTCFQPKVNVPSKSLTKLDSIVHQRSILGVLVTKKEFKLISRQNQDLGFVYRLPQAQIKGMSLPEPQKCCTSLDATGWG